MASNAEHRDFILDQLSDLNPTYKSMMGEYLIYVNGIYFGGIFDDRFLLKITETNNNYRLSKVLLYQNCLCTSW